MLARTEATAPLLFAGWLGDGDESEEVPLIFLARATNALNLSSEGGLMAKTIPWPQCLSCLQYTQIGLSSLTVTLKVGSAEPFATGWKSESKPFSLEVNSSLRQGSSKEDCVTV